MPHASITFCVILNIQTHTPLLKYKWKEWKGRLFAKGYVCQRVNNSIKELSKWLTSILLLATQEPIANLLSVMTHKKQTAESATIEKYSDIFAARLLLMIMDVGTAETNPSAKDNTASIFTFSLLK